MQSVGGQTLAESLGVTTGSIVLELGFDDDCSEEIREAFAQAAGSAIIDFDEVDVADVSLVWFRDGDEDLIDLLVDAIAPLTDTGVVWLMTPKPGRDGHVTPADIADAAPTAGLAVTRTVSASRDWQGTRLVTPKGNRR
jgi:hypothetical protein